MVAARRQATAAAGRAYSHSRVELLHEAPGLSHGTPLHQPGWEAGASQRLPGGDQVGRVNAADDCRAGADFPVAAHAVRRRDQFGCLGAPLEVILLADASAPLEGANV